MNNYLVVLFALVAGAFAAPPIRDECSSVYCDVVKCVDAVKDDGECCLRCPLGENCWMGDEIIEAGKQIVRKSGDASCPIICSCPYMDEYREKGPDTTANCFYSCDGQQIDVDAYAPAPGFAKKRSFGKRKAKNQRSLGAFQDIFQPFAEI